MISYNGANSQTKWLLLTKHIKTTFLNKHILFENKYFIIGLQNENNIK